MKCEEKKKKRRKEEVKEKKKKKKNEKEGGREREEEEKEEGIKVGNYCWNQICPWQCNITKGNLDHVKVRPGRGRIRERKGGKDRGGGG